MKLFFFFFLHNTGHLTTTMLYEFRIDQLGSLLSLHTLFVTAWVSSWFSRLMPQSKVMWDRLTGNPPKDMPV